MDYLKKEFPNYDENVLEKIFSKREKISDYSRDKMYIKLITQHHDFLKTKDTYIYNYHMYPIIKIYIQTSVKTVERYNEYISLITWRDFHINFPHLLYNYRRVKDDRLDPKSYCYWYIDNDSYYPESEEEFINLLYANMEKWYGPEEKNIEKRIEILEKNNKNLKNSCIEDIHIDNFFGLL